MIILLSICIISISVITGLYGVALLLRLRKEFKTEFFNSFFYYHLLIIVFGIYGILGSTFIREILLRFDTESKIIELVAQFIPFMGIPFMIAGWFVLIKMTAELGGKKISQWITIGYFVICTSGLLLYGYQIKYLASSFLVEAISLRQSIRVAFYSIDLTINALVAIFLIIHSTSEKSKQHRIFMVRFALIALLISIFKGITLHFAEQFLISGYYYLLVYFAGNLPLIFLANTYFTKHITITPKGLNREDLISTFGITQREKEIIEQICLGKTNKEIAEELFITLQTVKDHTHNIFRKVNVTNRVQLVQLFNAN